jgi:hypothetical protein
MRCCWATFFSGLVVVGSLAASAWATDPAADSFSKAAKTSQTPISAKERALAEFDTNGDGKLSDTERRAARTALQRKRRLVQKEQSGEGSSSSSQTAANSNYAGNGMSNYGTGTGGYGGLGLSNPYGMGNSMGTYYYYGTGMFSQGMPSAMSGGGGGGACMSSGGGGHR